MMKIALGSDHAGFTYKQQMKARLGELGHEVVDFGTDSEESCDYPDFIQPAAQAVASGECDRAIVLGGSGNGEAIAANKIAGIRCAVAWSEETARWGRMHNDANCLSIGQRTISEENALKYMKIFLDTEFEGGRHVARIAKIEPAEPNPTSC